MGFLRAIADSSFLIVFGAGGPGKPADVDKRIMSYFLIDVDCFLWKNKISLFYPKVSGRLQQIDPLTVRY